MRTKRTITADDARLIEDENGLERGSFAFNRPATMAEAIYLDQVQPITHFAVTVELLPGSLALVIPPLGVALPASRATIKDVQALWVLACLARDKTIVGPPLNEGLVLVVTHPTIYGTRASFSLPADAIRTISAQDQRPDLLLPKFDFVPPTEFEESSPGLFIRDLTVRRVISGASLSFQGVTTFQHHSPESVFEAIANSRARVLKPMSGGQLDCLPTEWLKRELNACGEPWKRIGQRAGRMSNMHSL